MKKALSAAFVVVVSSTGCGDKPTTNPPEMSGNPPVTPPSASGQAASATASAAVVPSPAASSSTTAVAEGAPAPDVELSLEDGKKVKLSSLKGKLVALYFYPKDETPGCTAEAEGIRDAWDDFKKANITVFGVSTQDASSHKEFIAKHKLPFQLVVDSDGAVAKAFGVPVNVGFAARQTFLIDASGKVKKIWRNVSPKDHAKELVAASK
jgi:peroxiredoxin Q/BCP